MKKPTRKSLKPGPTQPTQPTQPTTRLTTSTKDWSSYTKEALEEQARTRRFVEQLLKQSIRQSQTLTANIQTCLHLYQIDQNSNLLAARIQSCIAQPLKEPVEVPEPVILLGERQAEAATVLGLWQRIRGNVSDK